MPESTFGLEFAIDDTDREMTARLKGFAPKKIFDAHVHLYDGAFLPNMGKEGSLFSRAGRVFGGREALAMASLPFEENTELAANFILMPDGAMADLQNGLRDASTRFLAEQLEQYPSCVGEVVVVPEDTVQSIEKQLCHPRIKGFKCYHTLAQGMAKTSDAPIGAYLPEAAWQVAEAQKLCITLHLVKDDALADPENASYLLRMCRQYPQATLILAHCGRGFAAWTALDSVKQFGAYENVWFDLAAVCEPAPMMAVLQAAGTKRVLWGSDAPISGQRGRCVSVGRGFLWLDPSLCPGVSPALVGTEALSAFFDAAGLMGLSREDVEDVFFGNANRLFFG